MFRSRLFRGFCLLLLCLIALSVLLVLPLRWLAPPVTALMIERKIESWIERKPIDIEHIWRPWSELPDDLKMAVIAAEDQKFLDHRGFDTDAIRAAFNHNEQGGSLRGASTLSQQVAKNLFLWSGRSWLRKGIEAWFTLLIELFWSKQRILEIYLNSVEWDVGIFGAQAAARHHFSVDASALSSRQASLLAAVLPNPRVWSAGHPSTYVNSRAAWIRQQVQQLGGNRFIDRLDN
ncbi:monofunctional biosynthetic peptidoglycan transglycosylase [Azomonas macrocytogenes]|uniref:Biosynthetic peptidoglycan transglycosylase n=1 Tax=Azomonas macrocytogenes TaxID=69962 RepID=A0A839T661_AZOMA|nr:monofunctional biosynthetic peptidoglycan transglycosylase [Azomonas macrocytogenes]MBB3103435.1 monofunctional biosynthetic peptidoglycan transglycosylase [Azomonas macrocytogenes]